MEKDRFESLIQSAKQALEHSELEQTDQKVKFASVAKYADKNAPSEFDLDESSETGAIEALLKSNLN